MTDPRVGPLKVVSFTYEIADEEGRVHERVDLPVSYLHGGRGDIWPQVEKALEGHAVGDDVEVTLVPEEAFGLPDPSLVMTDDLANVPQEYRHLGAEAEFRNSLGESKMFVVTRIEDGRITLDGNHPLAGRTLTFRLTVTGVREPTGEEVSQGRPAGATPLH